MLYLMPFTAAAHTLNHSAMPDAPVVDDHETHGWLLDAIAVANRTLPRLVARHGG
ncbi:MAG TPA: hypothetical protein VLR88_02405 [Propionibacteriaceae bacterium]|nr:hypothetical protein [Propionibacteriaceae bacterium]